jgi:type II secretory pathway component PulF
MLDRAYYLKGSRLFSRDELIKRIQRGLIYPISLLVIAYAVWWYGREVGLPLSMRPVIDANSFISGLMAFLLRLPINFLWSVIIVILGTSAWIFFYRVLLTGQTVSDTRVTREIPAALQEHWQVEIIMAAIMALVAPFIFPK